jgi:hypothetical protein
MTVKKQSDRKTYDEATRLQFGLISKRDDSLADFAINAQAANLAILQTIGVTYLTKENQTWLEDYIKNLGRAQYVSQLDALSQASIFLSQQNAPDKTQKTQKTPLDNLELGDK